MGEFIGRERELKVLEEAWRRSASSCIPIYGRRRVGKSELILHFLQGKKALYFLGKKAPAGLQIREFLEIAAGELDEPLLASHPAEHWGEALRIVLARKPAGQKIVLALDEFQWMAEASPELPSVLQELWDREWQHDGEVMLILCGSFVGFMEREVLGRRSPLFGRRTAQILLEPFGFREAALFHPAYSWVDRAKTYFVCGGVPYYLRSFSDRRSFDMNVMSQILDEYAALHREPDFLLREELREVESYDALLQALAGGAVRIRDIAKVSGIAATNLSYYLKQLRELGYVERRFPLTDGAKNSRQVRYGVKDPLLRFWFRFLFPEQSQIRRFDPERAFRQLIEPKLDAYFGHCFERLCREALVHLYDAEGVTAAFEVGEFWSKQMQVDLVGLRRDGWTDLGECKWGRVDSSASVEKELAHKRELFPNKRGATIGLRAFSRHGKPGTASSKVRWHSLEQLYGEGLEP